MTKDGHELRVLIADSDPALCAALRFAFELEGMVVRTVADRTELGAEANDFRADCLVLDLTLGGQDGLQVLEGLCRTGWSSPVIVTATHPSRDARKRIESAGAWLVEKPLIGEALIDRVRVLGAPAGAA